MDLQKQTFKLLWMCLFGSASSQLLGFAQWQTRCIQIVHCSPQSRGFWKCEHFLLAKSCQHVSDIIIALTSVGRRRPWRLQWQIAVAAAVALWQIAAAVPCSCGGCGTCGLVVLKGFGNKENKDTIHNTFKLAYDAACIGGDVVAGAVRPNKSLLHFNMSGFSRMFALLGEDTE